MTETTRNKSNDDLERAVENVAGLGRLWARHGLEIGKSALETSATTLRTTADLLGQISSRISDEPAENTEDGAQDEHPA